MLFNSTLKRSRSPANIDSIQSRKRVAQWGYCDLPPLDYREIQNDEYEVDILADCKHSESKNSVNANTDPDYGSAAIEQNYQTVRHHSDDLSFQEYQNEVIQDTVEIECEATLTESEDAMKAEVSTNQTTAHEESHRIIELLPTQSYFSREGEMGWPNVLETLLEYEKRLPFFFSVPGVEAVKLRLIGNDVRHYAESLVEQYNNLEVTMTNLLLEEDDRVEKESMPYSARELPADTNQYDIIVLMNVEMWVRDLDSILTWVNKYLKPHGCLEVHGIDSVQQKDQSRAGLGFSPVQIWHRKLLHEILVIGVHDWKNAIQRSPWHSQSGIQVRNVEIRPSIFDPGAEDHVSKLCRENLVELNMLRRQRYVTDNDESEWDRAVVTYFVCIGFSLGPIS